MKILALILILFSCAPLDGTQAFWQTYTLTEVKDYWRYGKDRMFLLVYDNGHGTRLEVPAEDTTGIKIGDTIQLLTKR